MDITQLNIALTSFKTAKEIINTLMEPKDFTNHQAVLIDLNNAVISAQGRRWSSKRKMGR